MLSPSGSSSMVIVCGPKLELDGCIVWNVHNNNKNNIHICIAPYGRNFIGAGPGSVLVGVRRGKRVSLGEEKCL